MKKMIFLAAFVLSVSMAKAQLSWDVRIGANLSGIEKSNANQKLGLKVGGGADFAFNDLFSLRSMLYYTRKGVSLDDAKFGFFPDNSLRLSYLQLLPIGASFHFPMTDHFSLVANVGPYIAYRINKLPSDLPIQYKSFDAGMNAGIDFVIKRFVIGVEAEYGLTKLSNNANKFHNTNYSLMFGYKF